MHSTCFKLGRTSHKKSRVDFDHYAYGANKQNWGGQQDAWVCFSVRGAGVICWLARGVWTKHLTVVIMTVVARCSAPPPPHPLDTADPTTANLDLFTRRQFRFIYT